MRAAQCAIESRFNILQDVEPLASTTNLLLGVGTRDGIKLTGRLCLNEGASSAQSARSQ
jgi:hypothetical protein